MILKYIIGEKRLLLKCFIILNIGKEMTNYI